ncbi:hypothetical protein L6452_02836 [Arctium lappa]|uniref:Uncharacterized protein n=1 Tax=Arctium lappa TaxID=4217 RepID=A0ACB9FK13_ARCLA|nr:hypothetical protein L6452_02836 [Arctium lappa]
MEQLAVWAYGADVKMVSDSVYGNVGGAGGGERYRVSVITFVVRLLGHFCDGMNSGGKVKEENVVNMELLL